MGVGSCACPEPLAKPPSRGSPGRRGGSGGTGHRSLLVVPGTTQGRQSLPSRSPSPAQRESGLKSGGPFCPGTKALGHFNSSEGLADSSDCQSTVAAGLPPPLLMMLIRNPAGQPLGGGGEERGVGSA